MLIYVCSPYAGDIRTNVKNAKRYSRYIVERGHIPFAPHLLFPQFMDDNDESERQKSLLFGQKMLDKCDEMWVFGESVSEGMYAEIKYAREKGYKIRWFAQDLTRTDVAPPMPAVNADE